MKSLNILISDHQKILSEGLKALFERDTDMKAFIAPLEAEKIVDLCKKHSIDLLITDIYSDDINGTEFITTLKKALPDLHILVYTMIRREYYIREMVRAEASGYLLKSSGFEELLGAIKTIMSGKRFFSEDITMSVMQTLKKDKGGLVFTEPARSLTERELEILKLICKEYTNQEIADKLYISVRTVDAHRRNLLQKTGARNTAGLVRFAMEHRCI